MELTVVVSVNNHGICSRSSHDVRKNMKNSPKMGVGLIGKNGFFGSRLLQLG